MKIDLTDKNGKPLHGAAKQAVISKYLGWQKDELDITFGSLSDRVSRIERQAKYLPITVIVALFVGCAAGKIIKPDLAVMAIGCAGGGVGMALVLSRQ